MDYPLTDKQQSILDKAIELLSPFSKETVSPYTTYFEHQDKNGDCINALSDYDICDDDKCFDKTFQELKKAYPRKKIGFATYSNDGDHERFGKCYQCGSYLNEFLTWIGEEIDHHIENTKTKDDLIISAFEITGCLYSMRWNSDERMSTWTKNNDFDEGIKRQKDFIKKVVDYATHIIKTLS